MKTRMKDVMLGAIVVILLTACVGLADLNTDLVGYWSFDDPGNLGRDDSGTGNHGSPVGGATPTSGVAGGAVHLNGSAYINVPDSPTLDLPGGRGTIAAFVRIDPSSTMSNEFGVSKSSSSSFPSTIAYQLLIREHVSGEMLESYVISDGANVDQGSNDDGADLKDSLWHHVAFTWSGPGGELLGYRDGIQVFQDNQTISTIKNLSVPVWIGAYRWQGIPRCMLGDMDEVRIYSRALSEDEIQELAGTAEPTPEEQIDEILEIAGTLVGVGSGSSAKGKLNAFINQLEQAKSYIEDGLLCEACLQLQDTYKKCDGQSNPDDTVTGSAESELAEKIEKLMESLSCPPAPDLGFGDDFVDPWPDTYSLNCIWKKTDWLWENPDFLQPINVNPENVSVSDGKLVLTVPANEYEAGQIESISQDFHYGYYEARIKASETEASKEFGVVNAFFMYSPKGNNNEIDIEFLSKDFIGNTGKVHFVLHPGNYHISRDLPFNPAAGFHNYGFKWSASSVDFFVDRHINPEPVETMSISDGFPVPSQPGKIMLNNWTGNPNWGGGPPSNTATMEVDWVSFTPQDD